MNIPKIFKEAIQKNLEIDGEITSTISQYSKILEENKLYFFEEYTDHGIKHIESLLNSSALLIEKKYFEEILSKSEISIGVFLLAVILHDIGMHLTPEGLQKLITGANDDIRIQSLDKFTWKELWEEYWAEVRRFGDKERKNIIGNVDWEFKIPDLTNRDKLTGEEKKLIGEFIRRYHPRIAHEIALKGFPTHSDCIPFANNLSKDIRNICGLIARSHGVDIRSLFDYLKNQFDDTWDRPYNIEVIFLMIVLRIADYFQIESSRVEKIILKLKTFKSIISEYEHFTHLDVEYSQPYKKDPETIIFQCTPRNSKIYFKLINLFKDVQRELDISWAIIGEIYGRETLEKQPRIVYRRIKSNIDNKANLAKKVNYIPEQISFKVSPQLPQLLVAPLYGNNPTFGVRELLQNALDACFERQKHEVDYNGLITISFIKRDEQIYFVIEDDGIGMTVDVIKNYFLSIGTSFRSNSNWKRNYLDVKGNSTVQRSGKFGIGVLAAFLLGNKIRVTTKNKASDEALFFETDLIDEQIEIFKVKQNDIGTKIEIPIDKNTIEELGDTYLSFDNWYFLSNPKLKYNDELGLFRKLGIKAPFPGFKDPLSDDWNVLEGTTFNKVLWKYNDIKQSSHLKSKFTQYFLCNGIKIPDGNFRRDGLILPNISIFDFDGKLPLSLNRNRLEGEWPFINNLYVAIYKDLIRKLLQFEIANPLVKSKIPVGKHDLFYHPAIGTFKILHSNNGFILLNKYFKAKNQTATVLRFSPLVATNFIDHFNTNNCFIYLGGKEAIAMSSFRNEVDLKNYKKGAILYLNEPMYKLIFNEKVNRYATIVKRNHTLTQNNGYVGVNYRNRDTIFNLEDLTANLKKCNYVLETSIGEFIPDVYTTTGGTLAQLLNEFLEGAKTIPYSMTERKNIFSNAFKKLGID